jgi:protein tyrosine phosphatase (PTP) superfamily phosphohydrolase (DUF442 family)
MSGYATRLPGPYIGAGPIVLLLVAWTIAQGRDARQEPATREDGPPARIQLPGIENTFRLSGRVYSGAEPRGEAAMRALRDLGVRTIISVDGARPDVAEARAHGLRYVHLPMGYGGPSREEVVTLVKAARTSDGPVYIHCHHGKHRGPTAAAFCALADEGWTRGRAADWLRQAGTSSDYPGLFESVSEFSMPGAAELAEVGDLFPEVTPPPAMVEAMVEIDERWGRLKSLRDAGDAALAAEAREMLANEATLLREAFVEAARLPESGSRGAEFQAAMNAAAEASNRLALALRSRETLDGRETGRGKGGRREAIELVGKSCTSCHATFRNVSKPKRESRG